jgi:hypothetical protein
LNARAVDTSEFGVVAVWSEFTGELTDAAEVRDSGPSLGEDGAGVRVDLREADGAPAGSLQPKVKASDA